MPEPEQTVTAPAAPAPVRWGLGDCALGWIVAQVGGLIAFVVVAALSGEDVTNGTDLSLGWLAVAQLGLWAGLLGVPLLSARLKGNGAVRDFGLRVTVWDPLIGLGAGLGTQLILVPLLYLPIFTLFDVSSDQLEAPARGLTDRATDPLGVTLLVLIVGVGAPIVEEIFYRGLVLRSLERRFGWNWAIAGSAVVFGLSHFELLQLPALVMLGVILGILVKVTGRLGPAIATHLVFNMITVIVLVSSR